MPHRKCASESSSPFGTEVVRVLVGPQKRSFSIHRRLLCSTSEYFRQSLDAIPASLSSSCRGGVSSHGRSSSTSASSPPSRQESVLWFADQSTQMFELFVLWLYRRRGFTTFVEEALCKAATESFYSRGDDKAAAAGRDLHWALVRLHLFAAAVGLPELQDVAMDALQDLYLRLDWDVSPRFVRLLYLDSDPDSSLRLRKWAVTMVAWTLSGASPSSTTRHGVVDPEFSALFEASPQLVEDYEAHLVKMTGSRADVAIKNPQLRIPTNSLRNDERQFGFRMCSFHSHRSTVGQGKCPHRTRVPPPPPPPPASRPVEPAASPLPTSKWALPTAPTAPAVATSDDAPGMATGWYDVYDDPVSETSSPVESVNQAPYEGRRRRVERSVSRAESLERNTQTSFLDDDFF